MEKFLMVSADGFARMYGQGERGMGHALLMEDGLWGDPLSVGGKITRACGGTLDCGKAVEKFLGDKRCPKCVEWLATESGSAEIERSRGAYFAWADGGETVRQFIADVLPTEENGSDVREAAPVADMTPGAARDAAVREIWTGGSDPDPVATRKAAVARERKRLADQKAKREAAREAAPVPAVAVATEIDPVMGRIAAADVPGPEGIAEIDARRAAREAREAAVKAASTPATYDGEVCASTGLTFGAMRAAVAAYYANGGEVPAEIATLPAPGRATRAQMITAGGRELPVIPCEFRGGVEIINPEKTHGKCPGCTSYIPLLPESEVREAAPKVSKIVCGSVGVAPAPGTRVQRDDHAVKVADDYNGKTSAPCPGCTRVIAVSRDGVMRRHNGLEAREAAAGSPDRIGTHNVGGVATPQLPANKRLTSKSVDIVEHGSIPGDTATADKRRQDESRCTRGNKVLKDATGGKVACPTCERTVELLKINRPNGDVSWKIPHHVRPGESVKHVGRGEVRDVTPRGDGRDVGKGAGARVALSRGHGSVDGSATTGSQNMAPVQPKGWIGKAGTGQLPATVRPGIDPEVSGDICPLPECKGQRKDVAHAGRSKGWRRRHSSKMGAYLTGRTEARDAERAAKIASGEIASTAERKAGRKAASTGSFAEGTCAGVVSHETRPEFAPKGERRPAGWKAGKVTRDTAREALKSVRKGK